MTARQRRSIRLPGYDYASPGAYFITLCARDRANLFGEVIDDVMRLNAYGEIVKAVWLAIPRHFRNVVLDAFVVMPNHFHAIVHILAPDPDTMYDPDAHDDGGVTYDDVAHDDVTHGRGEASPPSLARYRLGGDASPLRGQRRVGGGGDPDNGAMTPGTAPQSLGAIIQNFKSISARRINQANRAPSSSVWQRNYYEHIIRGDRELDAIRKYIADNPMQWALDRDNPAHASPGPAARERHTP